MFARRQRIRADKTLWRQAETVAELGGLMASWLDGELLWRPDAGPGLDPETDGLVPLLARATRAGYLITDSQPACDEVGYDGRRWWQRAAVTGFVADDRLLQALARVAEAHQLTILVRSAHDRFPGPRMTVTRVDDEPHTRFGGHLSERDLRHIWQGLSQSATADLVDAHQVTLIDPQFGRTDQLWTALDTALDMRVAA